MRNYQVLNLVWPTTVLIVECLPGTAAGAASRRGPARTSGRAAFSVLAGGAARMTAPPAVQHTGVRPRLKDGTRSTARSTAHSGVCAAPAVMRLVLPRVGLCFAHQSSTLRIVNLAKCYSAYKHRCVKP